MPGTSVQISTRLRAEQRAEIRRRRIRAAAAQHRGAAVGMARDEALRQQQARRLLAEALRVAWRRRRGGRTPTVASTTRSGSAARSLRASRAHRTSRSPAPARAGRRRRASTTAVRPAPGVRPASRACAFPAARPMRARAARRSARRARVSGSRSSSRANSSVPRDQRLDAGRRVGAIGDRLQRVGDARQRRHHHQHARAILGHAAGGDPADVVPAVAARHRSAAELEHDPAIGIGHGILEGFGRAGEATGPAISCAF